MIANCVGNVKRRVQADNPSRHRAVDRIAAVIYDCRTQREVMYLETLTGMERTATCGELRISNVGKEVQLAGWVSRRRDHGGLIFVDMRDRSGLVQVVFDGSTAGLDFAK